MSADSQSFDPYRSPSLPDVPYAGPPPRGRTGWLTTLCVLCIVLGALGLVNSAFGTLGMLVGKRFQQMMAAQPQPGMPADLQEAQQKMQEDMYAIQTKYFVPLALSILVRVILCTVLVIGGVRALGLSEQGRKLLLFACAFAVVFEGLQTILQSIIAMENMSIMHGFMETMATQGSKGPENIEGIMKTTIGFIRIFSLVMIGAIALAKISLYLFGVVYLRTPTVIALFQAHQPQAPTVSDI